MSAVESNLAPESTEPGSAPRNFLEQIIEAHNAQGTYGGQVVTRFPPEPNGYLHLGHAKSIVLNFGLARKYGGRCHLRMDDTNPTTEETEYVESIQADVRWLGGDWGEHFYYASDYFERLFEIALHLIDRGLAYVDDQTVEEIRLNRGGLSEPGKPSPWRDRSPAENRDLLLRMRAGEFPDGAKVLRAKIDMGAANILMRDPLMYRIRHARHHRTGDTWCIYPMYDYAHGLSDAIEGITHSICTLEFENNRELYDWFVQHSGIEPPVPHQYEFARLNVDYTVLSKRRLIQLAQDKLTGWDDPRMPTITGLRRRGIRAEAIRAFCEDVGVTKANSVVDLSRLEYFIRDDLNHLVPRVMAVTEPLELIVEGLAEDHPEFIEAPLYPHDHPLEGSRPLGFGARLYIERDDFAVEAPKGWHRLAPGMSVRLRYAGIVRYLRHDLDGAGEVQRVYVRLLSEVEAAEEKVKGTLHWLSAAHAKPAQFRLYDRLFSEQSPGERTGDYLDDLNPDSLVVREGFIEAFAAEQPAGTRYQFERVGYFIDDVKDSRPGALIFNRIVTLRDSWAKQQRREQPAAQPSAQRAAEASAPKGSTRPTKRTKAQLRAAARAEHPQLAERFARYQQADGLSAEAADLLTGDPDLSALFEATRAAYAGELPDLVRFFTNVFTGAVGDRAYGELPFGGAQIAALLGLIDAGQLTLRAGKDVLAALIERGGDPAQHMRDLGLDRPEGVDLLGPAIAQVLQEKADFVARYRGGEDKLFGFFVGQVLRATGGRADPVRVREALLSALQDG